VQDHVIEIHSLRFRKRLSSPDFRKRAIQSVEDLIDCHEIEVLAGRTLPQPIVITEHVGRSLEASCAVGFVDGIGESPSRVWCGTF
jgi:hypothetical protein